MGIVSFRTDAQVDAALASLTTDGTDRSTVIRRAILTAHAMRLHAEAEVLANDPADVAEARTVMTEMEFLRAQ